MNDVKTLRVHYTISTKLMAKYASRLMAVCFSAWQISNKKRICMKNRTHGTELKETKHHSNIALLNI